MLGLGLLLASEHGAMCPNAALARARECRRVRRLADQVRSTWFSDEFIAPSGWEMSQFHWAVRERRRDSLRYAASLLLTPTVADWRSVHLARPLSPLYYLVRPLRLLGKYGLDQMRGARKT
jgi:hypothetical protein